MGSVVVGSSDGSTLEAGAGSMGVGTLGDCSSVNVMRRGVAWKVGLGSERERGAEYGDVVGK